MANILQKLVVPILSHDECSKTKYGDFVGANPAFLCAGFEEGGKDACTVSNIVESSINLTDSNSFRS